MIALSCGARRLTLTIRESNFMNQIGSRLRGGALLSWLACTLACSDKDTVVINGGPLEPEPESNSLSQSLFVANQGSLVSYDIASAQERPGAVQGVTSPTDMQALDDGTVLVNLTDQNHVLIVDPRTMLEIARVHTSFNTAQRPVHSYISPTRNGKKYWLALNDGTEGERSTNSAAFLDLSPDSSRYLEHVGEVPVGIGHHKAAFSATRERVVISNIADCERVLGVYDYSDITQIQEVAVLSSAEAGWDGSSFAKTCDATYQMGLPPAPHGCATSIVSNEAYCNVTNSGDLVVIDLDAATPSFQRVPTAGGGGGYTKASHDGRYIYSLQGEPREGAGGAECQVGQLAVLDASTDRVVAQVPLGYLGANCTQSLLGTDEETTEPAHTVISADSSKLFITLAGGFEVESARVRQQLVFDLSDPAAPAQLPSIPVGTSTGYHGDSLSGDGRWLFIANNIDDSVTQIDASSLDVVRTWPVGSRPQVLATFGSAEGPSVQTGPLDFDAQGAR
ncbi:MAG: Virginiamycin lyase [Pseudomonadota bacterium]